MELPATTRIPGRASTTCPQAEFLIGLEHGVLKGGPPGQVPGCHIAPYQRPSRSQGPLHASSQRSLDRWQLCVCALRPG